jgi:hypothetical protein
MVNRTAYDLVNQSLQGRIFSTADHGGVKYLLYWQTVQDLTNRDSYNFRFLDLSSRPIITVDSSPKDLQHITEIPLVALGPKKVTDIKFALSDFLESARTSWPSDITKLVIPEELTLK